MYDQRQNLSDGARLFVDGLRICFLAMQNGECYPCKLRTSKVNLRLNIGANHLEEMVTLLVCFSLRKLVLNPPETAQISDDESLLLQQVQRIEHGHHNLQELFNGNPLHPKLQNLFRLATNLYLKQIQVEGFTTSSLQLVEESGTAVNQKVYADPQGNALPSLGKRKPSLKLAYPADRLQTTKVPE